MLRHIAQANEESEQKPLMPAPPPNAIENSCLQPSQPAEVPPTVGHHYGRPAASANAHNEVEFARNEVEFGGHTFIQPYPPTPDSSAFFRRDHSHASGVSRQGWSHLSRRSNYWTASIRTGNQAARP
eukprot:2064274-Pleurochrysis_carterae.AAC.1